MAADSGRFDDLASAFLDSELSEAEVREFNELLDSAPRFKQRFEQIQDARELLRGVPGASVSGQQQSEFVDSLLLKLGGVDDVNLSTLDHEAAELVSVYADGNLNPLDVERVEELIRADAAASQLCDSIGFQKQAVEGLPLTDFDPGFASFLTETLDECARIERAELESQASQHKWNELQNKALKSIPILIFTCVIGAIGITGQALLNNDGTASSDLAKLPTSNPESKLRTPRQVFDLRNPIRRPESSLDDAKFETRDSTAQSAKATKPNSPTTVEQQPRIPVKPTVTADRRKDSDKKEVKSVEDSAPTETPPQEPAELDLRELARLIDVVRSRKSVHAQRLGALARLGEFPHSKTYELLSEILRGRFQSYPEPTQIQRSALEVLPMLDTVEAAQLAWAVEPQSKRCSLHEAELVTCVSGFRTSEAVKLLSKLACEPGNSRHNFAVLTGLSWPKNMVTAETIRGILASRLERKKLGVDRVAFLHQQMTRCLGYIGDQQSTAILATIATTQRDIDTPVRQGAIEALGELGNATAIEVLSKTLFENSRRARSVRRTAALTLSRFKDLKALELLISRLSEEKSRRVRLAIEESLFRLTGLRFKSLQEWSDWLAQVKKTAPSGGLFAGRGLLKGIGNSAFGIPDNSRCRLFMLDTSQSMAFKQRFDRARHELVQTLGTWLDETSKRKQVFFNVLIFDDHPRLLFRAPRFDFVRLTAESVATAKSRLNALKTRRSKTNLLDAFVKAFQLRDNGQLESIYFITDGISSLGARKNRAILFDVKELNRQRQISIHTLGFYYTDGPLLLDLRRDSQPNERPFQALLRRLATENHGFFASTIKLEKPNPKKKP